MNNLKHNRLLLIIISVEIAAVVIMGMLAIREKMNSHIVSPTLDCWQSRYIIYNEGYVVVSDDISEDEFSNVEIDLLYGPYMKLSPGGYTYAVEYECDDDQKCYVHAFEGYKSVKDSVNVLKAGKKSYKGHFIVNDDVDNLEIRILYNGNGALRINNITVVSGPYRVICQMLQLIVIAVILNLVIFYWVRICNVASTIYYCINNRFDNCSELFKRYDGIDLLKLLAAFLVINVHMPISGLVGDIWLGFCRSAVPVFFIISGFFYTSVVNRGKQWNQIKKITFLIVISSLLYYLTTLIISKPNIVKYTAGLFTLEKLKWLIIYNKSPFEYHLWYLNALLYVLVIFYAAWKKNLEKIIIMVSPFLLIIGLSIGEYSRLIWNREIYHVYSRGFLLEGIPFFAIGVFLYRLCCVKRPKTIILLLVVLGSLFITAIEVILLAKNDVGADGDLYIGTVFLAVFLVLLFANISIKQKAFKFLSVLGRRYSTTIYIVHVLMISLWNILYEASGYSFIVYYLGALTVFIGSLLIAVICSESKSILSRGKYKDSINTTNEIKE